MTKQKIQIAVVEDHTLLRKALLDFIHLFKEYKVVLEAANGQELIDQLQNSVLPDIILLDINMPVMNGYETMTWLQKHYPQIKVLVLSMYSDEASVIKMLKLGAKGYITKNAEPEELKQALDCVYEKNFFLSEYVSGKVISGLNQSVDRINDPMQFTAGERGVLQMLCSELSYREIAVEMGIPVRTVEEHRNTLLQKLQLKTRVGLVLYALKNELVEA